MISGVLLLMVTTDSGIYFSGRCGDQDLKAYFRYPLVKAGIIYRLNLRAVRVPPLYGGSTRGTVAVPPLFGCMTDKK